MRCSLEAEQELTNERSGKSIAGRRKNMGMRDCVRSVGLEEASAGRIESGMGWS